MVRRILVQFLVAVVALVALALVGLAAAGALYHPEAAIPAGFAGKHVVVNGTALRVLQQGRGRDLLLIHGSPGSIEDWTPLMNVLGDGFRVTVFDRPGHGFSADTGEYSYEHNAQLALAVIDTLKLEDVIVAGHSYGGSTALALALHAPPALRACVIVDSAAYEPSREVRPLYRVLGVPWLGIGVARALGQGFVAKRVETGLRAEFRGHAPAGFTEQRMRLWSSPKVMHALAEEISGAAAGLLRISPRYGQIQRPISIVAQADDAFRRTTAERLQRDIAGAELELVSGTGHYIQVEKPLVVARAIRRAAGRP